MRKIFSQLSLKILGLALLLAFAFNAKAQTAQISELKYYRSIFPEENGKIKSIGNTNFEYYRSIFPEENGKIKSIGNVTIEYYRSIFPEENGNIKSITGEAGSDFNSSAIEIYYFILNANSK
jgi:hypothetical protein